MVNSFRVPQFEEGVRWGTAFFPKMGGKKRELRDFSCSPARGEAGCLGAGLLGGGLFSLVLELFGRT